MAHGLIGDVIERKANPTVSRNVSTGSGGSTETGFPTVYHRSKVESAFKRARQDERKPIRLGDYGGRPMDVGVSRRHIEYANVDLDTPRLAEDWKTEISRTNERMVANMDSEERERERQDILDRFGKGIDDLMTKVRDARERRATRQITNAKDVSHSGTSSNIASVSDSATSSPPARTVRKIRFAEPTEADVHVYESQPPSPKRTLALLPPPTDKLGDISSLGSFKGASTTTASFIGQSVSSRGHIEPDSPEEGTPEDIRQRFFPSELPPETNPALAWMLTPPPSVSSPTSDYKMSSTQEQPDPHPVQEPRYTLTGIRLSPAQISNLPSHLGLHHHSTSSPLDTPAGYTMSDLLLLSRSSVPAQRASILGVLTKLLAHTREQRYKFEYEQSSPPLAEAQENSSSVVEVADDIDLDVLRSALLDTAVGALGKKGGVGQRGVELLWEVTVGFIRLDYGVIDLRDLTCVDLTPRTSPIASTNADLSNTSRRGADLTMSIPVSSILPKLRQHLITSPSPLSRTYTQVLEILLLISHFKAHARTIVISEMDHGLMSIMLDHHLRSPFGPGDEGPQDNRANPISIRVLQTLSQSSRENAVKLMGPADVLLRYITESRSPLTPARQHSNGRSRLSIALLEETLRFYTILSQYGLYAQFATITQDQFSHIGGWILDALRSGSDPAAVSLSRSYINLLGTLIVCATDPHQTTPSHDILWSQVLGWGWAEWIINIAELLSSTSETACSSHTLTTAATQGLWTDIFHAITNWMEGATVNGVKGGEAEKTSVIARLRPLLQPSCAAAYAISDAVAALQAWELPPILETPNLDTLAASANLLAATMRLAGACFIPGAADTPFHFPAEEIKALCVHISDKTLSQGPFSLLFIGGIRPPESIHVFIKPLSLLLVSQLKLWHRLIQFLDEAGGVLVAQVEAWTTQALRILGILLLGDEDHAKWIIETMCKNINPEFVRKVLPQTEVPSEIWGENGIKALLPFLIHSLRPTPLTDEEETDQHQLTYVAPVISTPRSISRCTTLNVPSVSYLQEAWHSYDSKVVLPLRNDWPMSPLNHLLRSGTSFAFRVLPSSWDASETDVVRTSLFLARILQELALNSDACSPWHMSFNEVIFACMKIFMLEHGQRHIDSGEEVFRDSFVARWMEDLLRPFTHTYSRASHLRSSQIVSLEQISRPFLGTSTTFYQFYTDFVALYDTVSFSHSLFASLLLPPVSMSYPKDYRKLLFGDFGHLLRTVKTDIPNALCQDVRDYLWPVERDADMIGWYLKSLLSGTHEFVHWIAIHHVAANIWPEFTNGHPVSRARAGPLLNGLLREGKAELLKEVALYRQREDEVWAPPSCFGLDENTSRITRLDWTENVGGQRARTILQNLILD